MAQGSSGKEGPNVFIVVIMQGKEVGEGKHSAQIHKQLEGPHLRPRSVLKPFKLDSPQGHWP